MLIVIWYLTTLFAMFLQPHKYAALLVNLAAALLIWPELYLAAINFALLLDLVFSPAEAKKTQYFSGLLLIYLLLTNFQAAAPLILSVMAALTIYRVITKRYHKQQSMVDKELPTVTLAIPARNEDHALTESLLAAVASDYPKLEILVLDDCSQDKTAQIIRSFAHSGVRFVHGSPPPEGWLGKNWAYQQLAEEASGKYILFAGVDVQLDRFSIRAAIEYIYAYDLDMLSMLPQRRHLDLGASLLQPLRYLFQLALPKLMQPPVLSTVWLVKSELVQNGYFESMAGEIIPEATLATGLRSKYRFVFSTKKLGITTRKRIRSQFDTAARTAFPMLRQSLALCVLASVIMLYLFILPLFTLSEQYQLITLALGALLQLTIFLQVRPRSWPVAVIQMPLSASIYIIALIKSAYSYLSGGVEWKGRNICIPVIEQSSPERSQ